jgi:alpha-L-rhamnosidase
MRAVLPLALFCSFAVAAAQNRGDLLTKPWAAKWIEAPGTAPEAYGVYHFRRSFELSNKPERFLVHVSADNRYQLYVNGVLSSWGPARSDLTHWRYETVDLAPHLNAGRNTLAAVVWNDGQYRAIAQISNRTGFLLQADSAENNTVNTGAEWKAAVDKAYSPNPAPANERTGYTAIAANERFDANLYPWGWEREDFDDSGWSHAHAFTPGAPRDAVDSPNRWMLTQRPIPLEEWKPARILRLRKAEGIHVPQGFPEHAAPVTIPANSRATLLLDQTYLTTGYPEITFSGGKDASVDIRYAEALYVTVHPINKGNRNEIQGKLFRGFADHYISDGGMRRLYRPLYWRTWRYLQLEIETAAQPLTIDDIAEVFSAYPFRRRASLRVDDEGINTEIQTILDTGWHTARLCAHETYMDCPYYEQLQYAGDARIQMLVSLYMTGDARLMRNGIEMLNSSRTAEGATYSRAPSSLQQYIPPFSLWWIGMVHDYWMYVDDPNFVKEMLPGVHAVLSFYSGFQKQNGSLEKMPWWNFVDWVKQWNRGIPPAEADGSSSTALDLQFLLALEWAADLERALGEAALAEECRSRAARLKSTVLDTDWDASRGLFADQPSHRTYSQNVNALALIAQIVPASQVRPLAERTLNDTELAPATIYFRAYVNSTLRMAGLGDRYLEQLGSWREMLKDGLTTWSEWNGSDSRSDCHAWGASPNFELFRTLAGVEPSAPGYSQVKIAPNLGALRHVEAVIPHPRGEIRVNYRVEGSAKRADITLPAGVTGTLEWFGTSHSLQPGVNHISLGGDSHAEGH